MFSKQEATQLKQEFWTTFGRYMSPVLSSEGEKINWINYKTGEKNIQFKLHADNKVATISIELSHSDPGVRELYFEQFLQFEKIFAQVVGDDWTWRTNDISSAGQSVSHIYASLAGKSVFNKHDWPELISFFKTKMIALDEFWNAVKYGFEALR